MKNVIEATILNGKFQGENTLLPQIPIVSTDVPIQFKRPQFPIILTSAMTINKSQGQKMSVCGLDLTTSCLHYLSTYFPLFWFLVRIRVRMTNAQCFSLSDEDRSAVSIPVP